MESEIWDGWEVSKTEKLEDYCFEKHDYQINIINNKDHWITQIVSLSDKSYPAVNTQHDSLQNAYRHAMMLGREVNK